MDDPRFVSVDPEGQENPSRRECLGKHLVFYLSDGTERYGTCEWWSLTHILIKPLDGDRYSLPCREVLAWEIAEWGLPAAWTDAQIGAMLSQRELALTPT